MRSASRTSALLAGCALSLVMSAPLVHADELQLPAAASQGSVSHPTRGMSMDKVTAAFGEPANRQPAVGQPPITRWEYPGFVVYFENRTVLHTVIKG